MGVAAQELALAAAAHPAAGIAGALGRAGVRLPTAGGGSAGLGLGSGSGARARGRHSRGKERGGKLIKPSNAAADGVSGSGAKPRVAGSSVPMQVMQLNM